MEIKGLTSAINAYNRAAGYDKSNLNTKTTAVRNEDRVQFSNVTVSDISAMKADIAKAVKSSCDSDRISELSAKISSGIYNVHGELTASSIID